MANEEFNRMLDEYMSGIRNKSSMPIPEKIRKLFKPRPKKKIQLDQGTTEEYIDVSDERLESDIIEEKKGFFAKLFKLFSAKPKSEMPKEVEIISEKPAEEFEKPKTEYEEPIVKEMKENFISRLVKKIICFRKKEKHEEPEKEPEIKTYNSEMDEDVVKVLNIVNSLFKKLPQNVKYEFKNSEDFEVYSNVLKKYHIIKKK